MRDTIKIAATVLIFLFIPGILISQNWLLTGNTPASSNFVGTIGATPLQLKTTYTVSAQPINFFTNNILRATILGNGNFGIGTNTTTPASMLHVNGAIRTGLASATSGVLIFNNSTNANTVTLQSGATATTYTLTLPAAQGNANQVLTNSGNGVLGWTTPANGIASVSVVSPISSGGGTAPVISLPQANGTASGYLSATDWNTFNSKQNSLWTTVGNTIYYNSGNVGIGTTTPGDKFLVAGTGNGTNVYGITISNLAGRVLNSSSQLTFGWDSPGHEVAAIRAIVTDATNVNGDLQFESVFNSAYKPTMMIKANGNVGVGTNSPGEKLEVNGNLKIAGNIIVPGMSGLGDRVVMVDANGNMKTPSAQTIYGGVPWATGGNSSTSGADFLGTCNASDLVFKTNALGSGGGERVRITSDGKVGIGLYDPAIANLPKHKLHLHSTDIYTPGSVQRVLHPGDLQSIFDSLSFDNTGARIAFPTNLPVNTSAVGLTSFQITNVTTGADETNGMLMGVDGNNGFINMQTAGSLAILSPDVLAIKSQNNLSVFSSNGDVQVKGKKLFFTSGFGASSTVNMNLSPDGNLKIGLGAINAQSKLEVVGSTNDASGSALNIMRQDGTSLVFVKNDGNVDIGTQSQRTALTVHGTINSCEVVVEKSNWCDYVFEKDYPLISLPELEKYLKEQKHLPKIPSAVEVEKNGINLGEMNKLLMEKMEEMTLYIIEQDKKIKELQRTVQKTNEK